MSAHYIALLGAAGSAERALVRRTPGYVLAIDTPSLLLACDSGADRLGFGNGHGVVMGTLFERSVLPAVERLEDEAASAAFDSDGASLVERFWGSYVAFLVQADGRVVIVRDPSGGAACYMAPSAGLCIVTSDVRCCATLGLIPLAIDWDSIAAFLLWPERRTRLTGLAGVRELMPGERMIAEGGETTVDSVWRPWRFTSRGMRIEDPREAASMLRETVLETVGSWHARYARPLVSLSGGLDSSIVLASTEGAAAAVTFMTNEPLGDERGYARLVAQQCSVPLLERELDPSSIDPRRSNAATLPRPVAHLFAQGLDRIWRDAALETGADALFHGGGGDNVFCYLASSTPYLDSLLARGPGRQSTAVLESLSRMTRVSAWRIRKAAVSKALIDRGRYRWLREPGMLSAKAIRAGGHVQDHPWFEHIPRFTLPGKQAHVASLVRIQNYLEAADPERIVPLVAPLVSQPVIETCLRIPTWLWCREGRNRVVARDAFRDLLPPAVVDRTGKGSPEAFDAQIVAARRGDIRALLSGGNLAAQGLIDCDAVDDALAGEGLLRGTRYLRVTELVDVEAWLQSWIGAPGSATVPQS